MPNDLTKNQKINAAGPVQNNVMSDIDWSGMKLKSLMLDID